MKRRKLGEILVEAGAITPAQLAEALEDQKRYGGRLGNILLDRRYITEKEFFRALSSQLRIPAVDFTKSTIPEAVIKLIPQELAEKHTIFPVALKQTPRGRVLVLAMADPTNVAIQDEIQFKTGYKVESAIALESTIRYVIREYFFERHGKGPYRMELSFDPTIEAESAPSLAGDEVEPGSREEFQIVHEREKEYDDLMPEHPAEEEPASPGGSAQPAPGDRPHFTRELKALLKLLHKKGIITPKEYLDEFLKTD